MKKPTLATIAGAGAVLLCSSPAAAAQGLERCEPIEPPPHERVDATVEGEGKATQFLADGGYSATRCDAAGRPVEAMVVRRTRTAYGTADLPEVIARPGVNTWMEYPEPLPGRSATEADKAAAAQLLDADSRRVIPPHRRDGTAEASAPPEDTTGGSASGPDRGCEFSDAVGLGGVIGARRMLYGIRTSSLPSAGMADAIVRGHHAWNYTQNPCGFNDVTNLTFDYVGATATSVHTYRDGASVRDHGDMGNVGCGLTALACALNFTYESTSLDYTGDYAETDQRYSNRVSWSSVGAADRYDQQNVAAHETGHSLGLAHVSESLPQVSLTMRPGSHIGMTSKRDLGRGDVLGMRFLYP